MWTDVIDLNDFYRSPTGAIARRLIHLRLRAMWPDVRGLSVAGVGYATPFLTSFQEEADRTIAVMPAYQGVTHWPPGERNLVALADECHLPFGDLSVDRLILIHLLENTERLRDTVREAWRVLNGVGKMIVVVPARRGFWSRNERTPFGNGKPYSMAQLRRLLRDCEFDPGEMTRALYMPPWRGRTWRHMAAPVERFGERFFPRFGGVIIMEATKQVYTATPARPVARRRLVVVPGAIGAARTRVSPAARQQDG